MSMPSPSCGVSPERSVRPLRIEAHQESAWFAFMDAWLPQSLCFAQSVTLRGDEVTSRNELNCTTEVRCASQRSQARYSVFCRSTAERLTVTAETTITSECAS